MTITLNGEPRHIPDATTIAGLLNDLHLDPRYLAVEINRQVVSRTKHAETCLQPGDVVEIVTLVGGG